MNLEMDNKYEAHDFSKIVTPEVIKKIRNIEFFANSQYGQLDIAATLEFYTGRYLKQLQDFTSISENTVIADIGTGFGWLPMAIRLTSNIKVIAIDPDKERLTTGMMIANYLGITEGIEWRVSYLGELSMQDKEADVVYCIEVLEHVYKSKKAIDDLCRVSSDLIILSTPNLWFPVIAHDSRLPFCHWLPVSLRKVYARMFNRLDREIDNLFWSPLSLNTRMKDFKRISKFFHYSSVRKYINTFPFYLPYGRGSRIVKISLIKRIYYSIISIFGKYSYVFSPSLAGVYKRKKI